MRKQKKRTLEEHEIAPTEDNDQVLLQRAIEGQTEAFDTLVRRYSAMLRRFIRRTLNTYSDDEQAEDVLQHVWLQFYRSLPTLSASHPIKPWLFRVASNRCIDEIRYRQRRHIVLFSTLEQEVDEDESSALTAIEDVYMLPEQVVEIQELQQTLERALAALPVKFRSVVILRSFSQLSFAEIAQRLKMPNGTVKTYFHRAQPLLREALQLS